MSDLLAKKDEVDAAASTAATNLAAHEIDTTSVHGIADTSVLETTTGSAAKVAAEAALARNADNLTSGTVADARIASTIARDSEVTSAVAAEATARDSAIATSAATRQPVDSDLTAIAGLDSSTAGAIASDGAGWIKKTYAQFKTALSLTKSDVGLGNVDNTADSSKTFTESQITNLTTDLAAKQPLDSDLTTIAGLTATTDNIIQSVGSAWASRTPTQVKTALGLVVGTDVEAHDADLTTIAGLSPSNDDIIQRKSGAWTNRTPAQLKTDLAIAESDVTNLTTDLGALQTQTAVQAAQIAANLAAQNGYYFGQGLVYSPSATAGKLDRTAGIGLFGTVEGKGAAATAIGSTVATLGAALTAGQAMWVNLEVDSSGGTNFNSGTPAAAADAQIPGTTAGRVSRGGIYIPFSAVALNAIDALLTTNNGNAKFYDWGITNGGPSPTGWQYDQNTWTFVSSTTGTGGGVITYKVVGINVTGYLKPGTLVSWDDGTNVPGYGVIASSSFSTDTTITLIAQSDYVMANHAIIYPRYSYVAAPLGFPSEFNWAGTLTGWGATPPTLPHNTWSPRPGARIAISVHYGSAGTSTATAHTLGLPVTARTVSNGSWDSAGKFTDNGVSTIGAAVVASGGTTVSLQGLISTNANTGSGSSTILGVQLEYPY